MKTILTAALLMAAVSTQASVTTTFSPDMAIPSGDPVGESDSESFTIGPAGATVTGITVGLTTTGGYNGDLYAYLEAPNGTGVILMDQPGTANDGFGAESSGMNIELSDTAPTSIQNVTGGAGTSLTGTYMADELLSALDDSPVDGTWTIFFADPDSGDGTTVLNSWSLDVDYSDYSVVPEPENAALGIFLGTLLVGAGCRRLVRIWRTAGGSH